VVEIEEVYSGRSCGEGRSESGRTQHSQGGGNNTARESEPTSRKKSSKEMEGTSENDQARSFSCLHVTEISKGTPKVERIFATKNTKARWSTGIMGFKPS